MTAAVVTHPHAAEAAQRVRDREQADHEAKMHNLAVERAKRIIDDPRGVSDAKLSTACTWYMRLSKGQGGGGDHYLRADAHLAAIRLREADAREAQETSLKVAMRHAPQVGAVTFGVLAASAAMLCFLSLIN